MLVLYNNLLLILFNSQIATIGAVFLGIMAMFLVLFRSLRVAIIAILPNMLAASVVLGGMGLAGIPLDMMTITIAAITVRSEERRVGKVCRCDEVLGEG